MNRNDNARTARRAVTFGAGIILGLSFLSGTASAAPSNERSTTYTESNDTNDNGTPNNVPDDGDNRHPSGKDRSVEHGGSGNQGKAQSDPDDNGHGPDRHYRTGADQPNGSGGMDMADQDGNNGCGNDDDFEDDNEGWCGKPKVKSTTPGATSSPGVDGGDIVKPVSNPEVAAEVIAQAVPAAIDATVTELVATPEVLATEASPAAAVVESAQARRETRVLGVSIERPAGDTGRGTEVLGVSFERGSLARTGFGLTMILAAVGMALVGIGIAIKKFNTQPV